MSWIGKVRLLLQPEKILHTAGSRPQVLGVSMWGALGVFILVGVCCMTMALADGTVYLRALVPPDETEVIVPQDLPEATDDIDEIDDAEQRLIDMLYVDDQNAAYQSVENDERWRVVRMRVTAYCPCSKCCGKFSDGITACNHRIQPGDVFVAADKSYRFGTDMIIPGYNRNQTVEVMDRGRLIKGNRLDVFFSSHSTAKKWGTRYLDVMVREK